MPVLPKPRPNLFLEGLESLGGLGKTAAGFLREDDPSMSAFDLAGPLGVASQAAKKGAAPFGSGLADFASRNLKKWFGDSKVIDAAGEPLTLYHATPEDFTVFKPGGKDPTMSGKGIWMSPNKFEQPAAHNIRRVPGKPGRVYGNQSGKFTPGTNVMPLHANIERPLVVDKTLVDAEGAIDASGKFYKDRIRGTKKWVKDVYGDSGIPYLLDDKTKKILEKDGYDGIMYYNLSGELDEVVAFRPDQIKSATGNRGTFDPTNPSIIAGLGGAAALSSQQTPPQRPRHPTQAQNGPQP